MSDAVALVLAALLLLSAALKLSGRQHIIAGYERVGVPRDKLRYLALVLLAGAGGLIAGVWWPVLGLAASACLVLYFALAITAHVRAHDYRHLATPLAYFVLSAASLALAA